MPETRKDKEWMRPSEAAALLRVTRNTVMNWAAKDELGSIKVAGLVFVSRADVMTRVKAAKKAA